MSPSKLSQTHAICSLVHDGGLFCKFLGVHRQDNAVKGRSSHAEIRACIPPAWRKCRAGLAHRDQRWVGAIRHSRASTSTHIPADLDSTRTPPGRHTCASFSVHKLAARVMAQRGARHSSSFTKSSHRSEGYEVCKAMAAARLPPMLVPSQACCKRSGSVRAATKQLVCSRWLFDS